MDLIDGIEIGTRGGGGSGAGDVDNEWITEAEYMRGVKRKRGR